jgi:tripartite-type tricarboxylate transporter receptor subunit TctC
MSMGSDHNRAPRRGRREWILAMALAAGAGAGGVSAQPARFPAGPVTVIVPAPAGSSVDGSTRALTEVLSKAWGVPVVVENRPGAGATLGVAAAARAAPDGHTLLMASTAFVQGPHLYKRLPYQLESFTPVAQIANAPLVFAVSSAVPATTPREFVALAKSASKPLSYASPGAGTTPHLFGRVLERVAGVEMLHVPYKGTPPAVVDVSAGLVSALFGSYSVLASQVQAGRLRLLGVTGPQRIAAAPKLPTLSEAGVPGFEALGFEGLFAPAGTPKPVVDLIARDVHKALAQPELRSYLVKAGLEPVAATSSEGFAQFVKHQSALWQQIIVSAGVTLD